MLIIIPCHAEAQVVVKKKSTMVELASYRTGIVKLTKHESGRIILSIRSDNQYDDLYLINLGSSKAEAIKSMESLVELASTIKKDESYEVHGLTKTYNAYKGLMKGELWLKGEYYAGWGKTGKSELKRILDFIMYDYQE